MGLRLYRVEVTHVGFVLAESEHEAEGFDAQIVGTEDFPDVDAMQIEPCATVKHCYEWAAEPHALVYHAGEREIELCEALDIHNGIRLPDGALVPEPPYRCEKTLNLFEKGKTDGHE